MHVLLTHTHTLPLTYVDEKLIHTLSFISSTVSSVYSDFADASDACLQMNPLAQGGSAGCAAADVACPARPREDPHTTITSKRAINRQLSFRAPRC